jgi:aspartate/methionine/tyrosine aminotransferase
VTRELVNNLPRPGSKVLDEQIDRLRREHPPGPLKLSGYPTDPLPPHITDAAARAARENAIAPSAGTRELRKAIARKLADENRIAIDPESEVLITHGAMHAVHLILQAVLSPGDEVLMFSPTYFFGGLVELVGGKPVYAPLDTKDRFRSRVEALEERLTSRTRVLLMNSPCNPTGYVPNVDELHGIAQLAERHNLLIVSDESYEKFVYDGRANVSIGSLKEARSRTLTIQSFTKTYGMAGWRTGYLAGPREYVSAAQKILEWTGLMCNYPAQAAAAAALQGPQEWFGDILKRFERNRDVMFEAIGSIPSVEAVKPGGTPFVLVDVSKRARPVGELSQRLLIEHGIPNVPGDAFQAPQHIRIPFGGTTQTVEEAGRRLTIALRRPSSA